MSETSDSAQSGSRAPDPKQKQSAEGATNPVRFTREPGHPSGTTLGYARVSRPDQRLDRQLDALRDAGCVKVFVDDGVSGAKASRPGLDELLAYMREGDVIVVQAVDRLGRTTRNLLELIDLLADRRVGLLILNLGVDTRTPAGQLVLTVVSAIAQMERDQLRERTIDGIAAARARGRVPGKRALLTSEQNTALIRMRRDGESISALARIFGVGRRTVYRVLAADRAKADSDTNDAAHR